METCHYTYRGLKSKAMRVLKLTPRALKNDENKLNGGGAILSGR